MAIIIDLRNQNVTRAIDMAKLSFVSAVGFWAIGTKLYTTEYEMPDWRITAAIALPVSIYAKNMLARMREAPQTYSGTVAGLCVGTLAGCVVSYVIDSAVSYFLKKPSFY